MERLTDTTGQLYACDNSLCAFNPKRMCVDCKYQEEANKRLAAYEDIGLTPGEVRVLAKAKADGRLFISPYAVGTEIFVIEANGRIRKGTIDNIDFSRLVSGRVIYSSFDDAAEAVIMAQEGAEE